MAKKKPVDPNAPRSPGSASGLFGLLGLVLGIGGSMLYGSLLGGSSYEVGQVAGKVAFPSMIVFGIAAYIVQERRVAEYNKGKAQKVVETIEPSADGDVFAPKDD